MRILLLHLDGKLPNLALMRLSAHHREQGDEVELRRIAVSCVEDKALRKALANLEPRLGDPVWDRVYGSAIFDSTTPLVARARELYPSAIFGGTGVSVASNLSDVGVDERGQLDYVIYPRFTSSIGFAMRGCRLKCEFCVVPKKEGRARANATISQIWRGEEHPRRVLLLDNDFFGNSTWPQLIAELREGHFKVSFTQGINARMLNDETAAAIASLDYRDDQMDRKRIYTAWDNKDDERTLFRGLDALVRHGVKPDHIMVYVLVGFWDGETHADREYRARKLKEYGARPYPMPYRRTPELKAFQKWFVQRKDYIPWDMWWGKAKGEPRKLGSRRVSLPLFP